MEHENTITHRERKKMQFKKMITVFFVVLSPVQFNTGRDSTVKYSLIYLPFN